MSVKEVSRFVLIQFMVVNLKHQTLLLPNLILKEKEN